ncbi:hypothetical protein BCR44DRAFT_78950 [Catenaria anguillulae PL171]|uniref:Uncharacterized protein n=1 Tax=Catenaria anguillulae PL171 TaxID=765915 RepID=A0A1Y2HWY5_9FUNG|nr:hypothetical protein BCR44DRAFT_78950 [Catenaria anguillulae PL171]
MSLNTSTVSPQLPLNVAELVLVTAIRSLPDPVNPKTEAGPIHSLLVVLPHDASMTATDLMRAALTQMWWVDLDFASRHGRVDLLNAMFHWRHCRPLTYTAKGLFDAGKNCHVDVLEWWYTKLDQGHMWFPEVEFYHSGVAEGLESADRSAPVAQLFEWYCKRYEVAERLRLQAGLAPGSKETPLHRAVSMGILAAVKHGHLAIIDTIRQWNVELRLNVAWYHVDLAVWHAVGTKDMDLCEWMSRVVSDDPWFDVQVVQRLAGAALASGSVEMVEWVLRNKQVDILNIAKALQCASVELTRWAIDEQHLVNLDPVTGKIVTGDGAPFHMDLCDVLKQRRSLSVTPVLEWWTENASRLGVSLGLKFRSWDVMGPMGEGNVGFVRWWLANCDVAAVLAEKNDLMFTVAVKSGNLELLGLLYQEPKTQPLFNTRCGINAATGYGMTDTLM